MKKIKNLFKKIKNPPFFYYYCHHVISKYVPEKFALKISNFNKKAYLPDENEFFLSTYDGSNQCVHPDMLFFNNKYWLAVTPYPYGMEEYENPCIYYGNSINSLISVSDNPIEKQRKHKRGFHLSDPCIFEWNSRIICAFRENIKKNNEEITYIYYTSSDDGVNWTSSELILQSPNDKLLSPAFYVEEENNNQIIHMNYVSYTNGSSSITHCILDENMNIIDIETQACENMPENYYIWHIAVSYENGMKISTGSKIKYGLFLIRNKTNSDIYKLYLTEQDNNGTWNFIKEIDIKDAIKNICYHPYKSCFIPNSQSII
ncbi:MAG: hypothetical protein K6G26_07510, partial [Lachnospiraceae bacterium]|nr:hypothetical protein [Lachnospiraceae bacterium]